MIFVDTNFFLRFLLKDVEDQYKEVKKFFLEASDGKHQLFTSLVVVFEVYWVILGQFHKDKKKVCKVLEKLLKLRFVEFDNLDFVRKALNIYATTNLDFEDSYNLVYAKSKGAGQFKTFDEKLQKKWKAQR